MPDNLGSSESVTYRARIVGANVMAFLRAREISLRNFAQAMQWPYAKAARLCEESEHLTYRSRDEAQPGAARRPGFSCM